MVANSLHQEVPVQVSEQAAAHIRRQLKARGSGLGIRLGVKKSGCSGMAYMLEFVDAENRDDLILEQHGTRFFVRPDDLIYLKGAELQFVREGVNEGLRFVNPNVSSECGCGESFSI